MSVTQRAIRGTRVVLRSKQVSDAANDFAWRTDPELATLDATHPLQQTFQEYLRQYQEELRYPSPWSERFAIETLDGEHIGNCMCYDINTARGEAEMGIMIGRKDFWNRRYGYDALLTLIDDTFGSTSLRLLYLHTLESNTRAQRCFQRCGFTPVSLIRRQGWKLVRMDLPRPQWYQIRSQCLALLEQQPPATPSPTPPGPLQR
ncbi:MAG: GNAT family N-acetyltransferase [Chloroflexi bacterium]|nr:GNAT family N-acetyltransferase [Chloroflexota bacterium]